MKIVDALGKACPLPVIETRKALKENNVVTTLVDNVVATENLKKLAAQLGCDYTMTQDRVDHFTVTITKKDGAPVPEEGDITVGSDYIVVVNSPTMGVGDEAFGRTLLQTFLSTLAEQDVLPKRIIFYNGGVPLVTKDSGSLDDLKKMASQGVEIYACGACLNYYGLTDQVAVGEVTNMFRIIEMMRTANRIVKP